MNFSLSLLKRLIISFLIMILAACENKIRVTGNLDGFKDINEETTLVKYKQENIPDASYSLLIGKDGIAALIFERSFEHVSIIKERSKWNSKTENLPVVTKIKDLYEIAFFKPRTKYGLHLLEKTVPKNHITPFSARLKEFEYIGKSSKNNHLARKYIKKHKYNLQIKTDSLLAISSNGDEKWVFPDLDGKINEFSLQDYFFKLGSDTLLVLWQDPPTLTLKKVRSKIIKDLKDNQVMVILIDGLGWDFYQHLFALDKIDMLGTQKLYPVRVPYPPCTKNSLACLITPEGKQIDTEISFFPDIPKGKKLFLLESDQSFYPSKHELILHTDKNFNGSIDDEIFMTALKKITEEHDLIFIHFHSLDDEGHRSGTYSRERIAVYAEILEYLTQLTDNYPGVIHLLSDHGMHNENGKGIHKTADYRDLLAIWGRIK